MLGIKDYRFCLFCFLFFSASWCTAKSGPTEAFLARCGDTYLESQHSGGYSRRTGSATPDSALN